MPKSIEFTHCHCCPSCSTAQVAKTGASGERLDEAQRQRQKRSGFGSMSQILSDVESENDQKLNFCWLLDSSDLISGEEYQSFAVCFGKCFSLNLRAFRIFELSCGYTATPCSHLWSHHIFEVINALTDRKSTHVPYRDSKLSRANTSDFHWNWS